MSDGRNGGGQGRSGRGGSGQNRGGGQGRGNQGRSGQGRSGQDRGNQGRSSGGRSGQGRPNRAGGARSERSDDRRSNDRRGGYERGNSGRSGNNERGGDRRGGQRNDRRFDRDRRPAREPRTAEQQEYDGPPIPDGVMAKDLDKFARQQLQNIPEKLAEKVARHLVMAGSLIADDPELAHRHALAARARAMRNALVREAVGETAYASGKWSDALAEFRAARRMSGNGMYAPMMADCERALGRPDKAIAYDTPEVRGKLDEAGNIELSIVVAGARRDRGQIEEAVRLLETEPLNSKNRAPWVARLRYAYADSLLAAGRTEDAIEWFHRTVAVDGDHSTDAAERVAELSGDPQE